MADDVQIEKKEKGFVSYLFTWVAVVFMIVALYVLSTGPVLKWGAGGDLFSFSACQTFYAPIDAVVRRSDRANDIMHWYFRKVWRIG